MDINIVKLKKYASECSVLYVEDDELIRTQTASFLGRFFPDVVLAEDGADGIDKYRKRKFDVVITDINMPNMNGIEMIEFIKEINYEQVVLVTSAYNDSTYLMKLINLGIMRFILKPFNNKQFLYVLYKIAEELSILKEQKRLQSEIDLLSKRAQTIVDQVHIGIVVIKDNKIEIANKAFLEIGGFDSFEKMQIEMPEIGVLFEEAAHCVCAESNSELIEQLKTLGDEDRKVRIMQGIHTLEYQVKLAEIEEDNSYILTFSDITAIHDALNLDRITKLPGKNFILEHIEVMQQKVSVIDIFLISIKHLDNVKKWYGKKEVLQAEVEFANTIKEIIKQEMPDSLLGYFAHNQFVLIPSEKNFESLYKKLESIHISSLALSDKHDFSEIEFTLSINIKVEHLSSDKELAEIEVDLENGFDLT